MMTIVRTNQNPYAWDIGTVALDQVANIEKTLPDDYISADGMHITASCRDYLLPLIQGEDMPPYQLGLPHYFRPDSIL